MTPFLLLFYKSLTIRRTCGVIVPSMKTNFHSALGCSLGQRSWVCTLLLVAFGFLALGSINVGASDPVGLYGLIEKVKFEPSDEKPERVVLWGSFSVAQGERGEQYKLPEKGYLYFSLPEKKPEVALKEWSDLKSIAGQKEVVGFSTRYGEPAKVRKETEQPRDPDPYRTGFGLVRMQKRGTEYGPVKALLESASKQPAKKS